MFSSLATPHLYGKGLKGRGGLRVLRVVQRRMNRYHSVIMRIPDMPDRAKMLPKVSFAFWLIVLLSAALAFSCRSQSQPEKPAAPTPVPQPVSIIGPPGFPAAVLGKPYPGTGIVTTVNRNERWVAIEHEEIKDLMPAMAMEFWVRNPSVMNGIRVGDKVEFVVVEDSKGQYITELKRVAKSR